ncbi:hypothetical protein CPB84DRAFT_1682235 [Gymnopilus junonius]|uniref:Transcriptional adapter n=1 Tax=Gymnopilus junonius TaxID=109634 RepID=A0A9P5NMA0_GYMJU|nr:hypothetical protein CPB84DRAFT_1682235 [Gymnopilus junonius]
MTVTQRKPQHLPDEIQTLNEPGVQYQCDSCACDLTHNIRIKCADPVCVTGEGVDLCPACFCAGKEFAKHQRGHAYRVIEMNSYPIFTEDWGADEELLLLTGISTHGIGNWKKIAEHVGTRTKEEVDEHYRKVYIESEKWPMPRMDLEFDIEPEVFHERKRRRITAMNDQEPPPPKVAPTSQPAVHEIATFLPGRLEFEHEVDNEAEDLVKDLEFGVVSDYGGDQLPEDENDLDVRARLKWEEEKRSGIFTGFRDPSSHAGKGPPPVNGSVNGYHINGDIKKVKSEDVSIANSNGDDEAADEPIQPQPYETKDSTTFKLSLLEMYFQRVDKRLETKAVIFERGLLDYRKMQAVDKKRPKEEREFLHRLRPFARLQTAEDYEAFATDMLYEALLRKRIQELQTYRRLGLSTSADIDKYESDLSKRVRPNFITQAAKVAPLRDYPVPNRSAGRQSSGPDPRRSSLVSFADSEDRKSRESTPRLGPVPGSNTGSTARRPPQPLNLANSPSLHLLTPAEQTLCSQLRILPKPYLVIKETLIREYARRGGKLRRREARDLVKIDVNKTSRVWDFLVQSGYLKITTEPSASAAPSITPSVSQSQDGRCVETTISSREDAHQAFSSTLAPINGSPQKDSQARISPRPPAPPAISSASSSQNGSLYSASLQSIPQSWTPST